MNGVRTSWGMEVVIQNLFIVFFIDLRYNVNVNRLYFIRRRHHVSL